jgi:cytochrome c biogenesis protein CcdA
MSLSQDVALALLQMVALAVPPVAVLLQMLRKAENLQWQTRKFSFGLAIASILSFLGAGVASLLYLETQFEVAALLVIGMGLVVLGLVPFAAFTAVLYREHRLSVGP